MEEVKEVLHYASQTKTSLTRIMLDNMVVVLSIGDVDVSMLEEAVKLIDGKFETEVGNFSNSFDLYYVCLYVKLSIQKPKSLALGHLLLLNLRSCGEHLLFGSE